jgi:hypothetical protein
MAEAVKIKNETAYNLIKLKNDYEIGLMINGDILGTIDFLGNRDYYMKIENFSDCYLEKYKDGLQNGIQVDIFIGVQVTVYYENDSIAMYRSYDEHGDYLIKLWEAEDRSRKILKIKDRIFRSKE